jgi:hypothetical protein
MGVSVRINPVWSLRRHLQAVSKGEVCWDGLVLGKFIYLSTRDNRARAQKVTHYEKIVEKGDGAGKIYISLY